MSEDGPSADDAAADLAELHGRIGEHMATVAAALHGLEEVRAELRRHIEAIREAED